MKSIVIIGSGQIGTTLAYLLAQNNYQIHLIDKNHPLLYIKHANIKFVELNIDDEYSTHQFFSNHHFQAIISCLPYYKTLLVAKLALAHNLHYFDLTEHVAVALQIKELAKNSDLAFVSQCGLAPGLIAIVASHLMDFFDSVNTIKLRCGALPQHTTNALHYALTWSTEGVINEYDNLCPAIKDGKFVAQPPLEDLEEVIINGTTYEAFNTSGGIGNFIDHCFGKVENLNYKTLRYPGHCEKMRFLMQELKLNKKRKLLKIMLENILPKTKQDVIILLVSAEGYQNEQFIEKVFCRKFYPKIIDNIEFSAIQMTTSSSAGAMIDLVLKNPTAYQGFIPLNRFSLTQLLENPLGSYFGNLADN